MAPRRRPTKKGETRMDAALDAMTPYGFPNTLVRRAVHQLLKVYGGNEGWVFIEDSAYTLLIDTLLLQQDANPSPQPQDCSMEDNPGDGPNEASPAGCSNRVLLPCSNTETSDDAPSTNQAIDTISAASETGTQLPIKAVDTTSATSRTVGELPIKPVDPSSATSELNNQVPIKEADNESDCHPAGDLALGEINGITPAEYPQTKSSQPGKRSRPCYGWISDDDDDDDEEELIELPPAPLSKALYRLVNDGIN